MSYTPVQNRFWSDGWVRQLNALDRYLFLYLLTNGRAKLTGIYELPLDLMAAESGIDEKDLRLSMLQRMEPKIYYKEGWVILVNYLGHKVSDSPKYLKGIQNELERLPASIREIAKSYGYPIDTLSIPIPTKLEETKLNIPVAEAPEPVRVEKDTSDSEESERVADGRRVKAKLAIYHLFSKTEQPWWRFAHERKSALSLFDLKGVEQVRAGKEFMEEHSDDEYCPQASTPSEYAKKLPALLRYKKKNDL